MMASQPCSRPIACRLVSACSTGSRPPSAWPNITPSSTNGRAIVSLVLSAGPLEVGEADEAAGVDAVAAGADAGIRCNAITVRLSSTKDATPGDEYRQSVCLEQGTIPKSR